MLDDLFSLVFRAADVRPEFTSARCLAVRQSPAACRRCADVCPHDAVTVRGRGVEIDEVDCSGCGLCVQACPSQALEPRVGIIGGGRSVKCSRVAGDAQTVHCLARLRPTDLHTLIRGRSAVVLARGECAACPIGGAAVAEAVEAVAEEARELLALRGREGDVRVEVRERLDDADTTEVLDRRALLRGGWRGLARSASAALAPLDPGDDAAPSVPREAARRYRALELSDLVPEREVPWPLPVVNDACILCPVCTKVCPTDALSRTFDDDGGGALHLAPERCIGCDACVGACPVDAVTMEPRPTWARASAEDEELYRKAPMGTSPATVAREG